MKVLLIGSGGREHALAWKISESEKLSKLYIAPGNAGMVNLGECINLDIGNFGDVSTFCLEQKIDLVMIGPEAPLVAGLVDHLEAKNINCCGPNKQAAMLEGSKAFTHDICHEYKIPAAKYAVFTDVLLAKKYLQSQDFPIVVKADGLAAGKGVIIAQDLAEAENAVDEIYSDKFGDAGRKIVIEEFLSGDELSFFVLSDGKIALYLGSAQDHKTVGEGDTGPNTGGMGTYSPTPIMNDALKNQVIKNIINPTLQAMRNRGYAFKGILFAGLMITKDGPKLLEYNVRFGDPETQVLMMRLKSDLLPLLYDAALGKLEDKIIEWHSQPAVCVVMAANGYPGDYKKGSEIKNLEVANNINYAKIFHAGTKFDGDKILANGGRVLGVTASGDNIKDACDKAYAIVNKIDWPEGFYRRDIAWRAIKNLSDDQT